jgi:epoxyqueuosine reductase
MSRARQGVWRERLGELGFDAVRVAALSEPPHDGLSGWLAKGQHADMHWMERSAAKRLDPQLVLPGAKSIVMLGVSYWKPDTSRPGHPIWARYAMNEDYHDTIKPALAAAGHALEEIFGAKSDDYRYYVDTGPVLERDWAARAGLGFVGKNAMLISRTDGNWLLLAAILTTLELEPDQPIRKKISAPGGGGEIGLLCGKCTRCLDACPTDAFAAPGVVDARRCISYQTIENKGVIPRELRAGIGRRIFGCDVCLEVCPWNRFAQAGRRVLLAARGEIAEIALRELLELTPERFAEIFRRTPIKRLKLTGLLRNACVVAGNAGDRSLVPQLVALATKHESALVRAHAIWAVGRLGAGGELAMARTNETDPIVRAEYAAEQTAAEPGRSDQGTA